VRVLIADDERTFARALAEMVRCGGHEVVDVVHSGLDAIRSYRRHKPEVVLMDFQMTRLNGLTACRNILSDDPKGRIVFLSATAENEQLAPRSSGAVGVLQKPIGLAMLEQVLHDVIEEPETLLAS
jgi:CheY-like chemotaxis protein